MGVASSRGRLRGRQINHKLWGSRSSGPRQEGYYITVIPRSQASLTGRATTVAAAQGAFAKNCIRASVHEGAGPPNRARGGSRKSPAKPHPPPATPESTGSTVTA